jgi:hypothetical protein
MFDFAEILPVLGKFTKVNLSKFVDKLNFKIFCVASKPKSSDSKSYL